MDPTFLPPMAGGLAGGIAANAARLPGGAILGALAGAAATQLATGNDTALPGWVRIAAQIGIGGAVGVRLAPTALRGLVPAIAWALPLLGVLMVTAVGAGVLYAVVSRLPVGVGVLATMPGGVAEVVAVSLEAGDDAAIVAAVHLGRQLLILLVLGAGLRLALGRKRSAALAERRSGTRPGVLWRPGETDVHVAVTWDATTGAWSLPACRTTPAQRWSDAAVEHTEGLGIAADPRSYVAFDLPSGDDETGHGLRAWAMRAALGAASSSVTWLPAPEAARRFGRGDRAVIDGFLSRRADED